ncbi:bifunctional diguanylate cyclase/phosphodiesterase [Deinococcus sp.]|uniref:bifunctional diguanylate cyclase/phosphodiesterase n=1 Tax=Deinococcus sp. TaxID=47478 RepID=UPI003C7CBF52
MFGGLARIAAVHYQTPVALISVMAEDRRWFRSGVGLGSRATDHHLSFCAYTAQARGVFVVSDAHQDARFGGAALLADELPIRFYAGVPIFSPSGDVLGTLCVIDTRPRDAHSFDPQVLSDLAGSVADQLERRRSPRWHSYEAHILSNIEDAVLVFDVSVRLEYVNEAARRLYGVLPEDYGRPGVSPFGVRWLNPEDEAQANAAALANQVWRGQVIHLLKDGRKLRVGLTLQPVLDAAGRRQGTVGTVRDLTAEYARRQQMLLVEQVAVNTSDAVLIAGPGSADPDGRLRVIYVNAAFTRLTGFSLEDMISDAGQMYAARLDPAVLRRMKIAYRRREAVRFELCIPVKGRQTLWVECSVTTAVLEDNQYPYWIGMVRDISEQVRRRTLDRDRRLLLEAALHQPRTEVMPLAVRMLEGQFPGMGVALVLNIPGEVASTLYGSPSFAADLDLAQMAALRGVWSEVLASGEATAVMTDLPGTGRPCWNFPLMSRANGVLGVLSLLSGEVGTALPGLGAQHQELLEDTARLVAVILERERAMRNFKTLARVDALTGLANAARFDEVLGRRLAQAAQAELALQERLVVGLIDLDRFKEVNDTLGHSAGDGLLQGVAGRLSQVLRPGELVARMGGDEFLLLLQLGPEERLEGMAERLRSVLEQPVDVAGRELFVHASIGLAVYPDDAQGAGELKRLADTAMYTAKRQGLGWAHVGRHGAARTPVSLSLETDLHRALGRDELFLAYQPLVDARTHAVTGIEALLRWNHPELGVISPAQFIPIAEANGLIVPFGAWMMQRAMGQAVAWQQQAPGLQLHLNLSARQFLHPDLVGMIGGLLRASSIDPGLVTLEITEGTLLDPHGAQDILTRLRALGLRLAIDDFGTGYSSLAYLKQFPIQSLKIDKSFIDGLREQEPGDPPASPATLGSPVNPGGTDAKIVRSLIGLAQSLGLSTVAEGVETAAQARALAVMGCDTLQGYLFSRPLLPEALEIYLQAAGFRSVPPT